MNSFVAVVSPKRDVKTVKTCLEGSHLLNQTLKIRRSSFVEDAFAIPTNIPCSRNGLETAGELESNEVKDEILRLCENYLAPDTLASLSFATVNVSADDRSNQLNGNPLHVAFEASVSDWKAKYPSAYLPDAAKFLSSLPRSYDLYSSLLLLPQNLFDAVIWQEFLSALRNIENGERFFYSCLADRMHVSHIAMDAPIPSRVSSSFQSDSENTLRSPSNLRVLYGDFGPACPAFPEYTPTASDFDQALWVSTRQNGIIQTWSPRYTMFSSGNVTEKERILNLETVHEAVKRGSENSLACSAVDLFAGIGYFAFSYAKAGVSKVLCWDLNPWSIEGLRRGAKANKWEAIVMNGDAVIDKSYLARQIAEACRGPQRLLIFSESNVKAQDRIYNMRDRLPPIRHVNCGMLPSASLVWKSAVEIVDPNLGGWIHLHETVFESDIKERARAITEETQQHFNSVRQSSDERQVLLEHIEKVKSIGPRLMHVVLDIKIPPRAEGAYLEI